MSAWLEDDPSKPSLIVIFWITVQNDEQR